MNFARPCTLAFFALMFACSASRREALPATTTGDIWTEYHAAHFVLDSDAPQDEARAWLADFETSYLVLSEFLVDRKDDPTPPTHVVLFSRGADLHRFIPPDTVAAFFSGVAN